MKLSVINYKQEGTLTKEYRPFHNLLDSDTGRIKDFTTKNLPVDLDHPIDIQCQPSYDGTVNLILNDDKNPPRIINSRFTKIEGERYRVIERNQVEQTNLYNEATLDSETRLCRIANTFAKFDLEAVLPTGQLMGGQYTFYLRYVDDDKNHTQIIAESGQISVFHGTYQHIKTISGTLLNEKTNKAIQLRISNLDQTFSKIQLLYSREYSSAQGVRMFETSILSKEYDITSDTMVITINGYEAVEKTDFTELNITYDKVNSVKTQAQTQNLLFFGNVDKHVVKNKDLQNIAYHIKVALKQDEKSVGNISSTYEKSVYDDLEQTEYYNPHNIYYKLGYWPDEYYRLGIVYIYNDDSRSDVFDLRGCDFEETDVNYENSDTYSRLYDDSGEMLYLPKDEFIYTHKKDNTVGVFHNKRCDVIKTDGVYPLYYEISLPDEVVNVLSNKYDIKGYFIVRQKRIPTIICQGFSIGINQECYIPMPNVEGQYIAEGFYNRVWGPTGDWLQLTDGGAATSDYDEIPYSQYGAIEAKITEDDTKHSFVLSKSINKRLYTTNNVSYSGLLSVDPMVNPFVKNTLNGDWFYVEPYISYESLKQDSKNKRHLVPKNLTYENVRRLYKTKSSFIPSDTPVKMIDEEVFSTRAGSGEDIQDCKFFDTTHRKVIDTVDKKWKETKDKKCRQKDQKELSMGVKLLRGEYTPYIGLSKKVVPNTVYNVRSGDFSVSNTLQYIKTRGLDASPFYAVTDWMPITQNTVDVYRGDCFSNTVTIRINRNFVDSETPTNDTIVDPATWAKFFRGISLIGTEGDSSDTTTKEADDEGQYTQWDKINRSDVNNVPLGLWVTFKCLSNYNLGLRAIDDSNIEEKALMGTSRGFYPVTGLSVHSANKLKESDVLNDGYSATVGKVSLYGYIETPYDQDQFDNRIMFSNLALNGDTRNGYRIFNELSHKDIDRQYGAITKLLPWGGHLLCVFEHGIAVVPVNPKALMATENNQSVYMYGVGVLGDTISPICEYLGSVWPDSIIRTPNGVYGVDTATKKIWFVEQGAQALGAYQCISDMKIQKFLNDNIDLKERDLTPTIALRNVKAHYNNHKGDVMFTFYNGDKEWNLCWNEREKTWVTKYSWIPLFSENLNNTYYSIDQKRAKLLSIAYSNKNTSKGLRSSNIKWIIEKGDTSNFETKLSVSGYDYLSKFNPTITNVSTSYIDENGEENLVKSLNFANFVVVDSDKSSVTIDYNKLKETYKEAVGKDIVPTYLIFDTNVNVTVAVYTDDSEEPSYASGGTFDDRFIVLIKDKNQSISTYNEYVKNGVYLHGRSGIFDELDYNDEDMTNQILPCKWYNRQEPFEFEFVVNQDTGIQKIFNNLVIISNNVQPKEIEYEIIGDSLNINKKGLYWNNEFLAKYNPIKTNGKLSYQLSQDLNKASITYDNVTNEYGIKVTQQCLNMKNVGRLSGNIQYKEDAWNVVIPPLQYTDKIMDTTTEEVATSTKEKSVRLRDKYIKIRVKYYGNDLAIISAINTLYTLSYA